MHSFAAYLCLVLSFFVTFGQALPVPQSLPTRNVTLSYNSSQIKFSSNWEVISSLSAQSTPPFTFSNAIGATLGVMLPNGTVAVDYLGIPRGNGGAYAVCMDCDMVDDTKGSWFPVDGNVPNLTNDDQARPTVLFSIATLDPNVVHTITVTNVPDRRFNNTGEITFESFNIKVVDSSGSTAETNEPTNSSSASDSPGPTSTSDSETSTGSEPTESASASGSSAAETSPSGTATSSDSQPTDSESDSTTSASSSSPTASSEHDKVSPTTAVTKTSPSVVAVIVVLCVLALFCLAVALILVYRMRRMRAAARIHDAESQAYGNLQWLTPNHIVPFTGMQEVPLSSTPARPKNPFEDQFPSNVPLELETPSDSTLMNKRGVTRPRSSFGNGLYDYYRPALR